MPVVPFTGLGYLSHGHPHIKHFTNGLLQCCPPGVALKSYLEATAGPECSGIVVMDTSQCAHVTSQLNGLHCLSVSWVQLKVLEVIYKALHYTGPTY